MVKFAIIEAPSNLGLRDTGVDRLPEALLSNCIDKKLQARVAGRIPAPPYNAQRDSKTGLLNIQAIAKYTLVLADKVGEILNLGEFPIVLGGDCSILLGGLLALRRRGRFGLFFADGHADFYQPEANINGEVASSELAFATGRGPKLLTSFEGYSQLVKDEDVVVFGFRDSAEQITFGSQPLPSSITAIDLNEIRGLGITKASEEALKRLSRNELDGFWLHLDADVLSDSIMPAVDYRQPGGLSWDELVKTLRLICTSNSAVGLNIAIYNPLLDPRNHIGPKLVEAIEKGLNPHVD